MKLEKVLQKIFVESLKMFHQFFHFWIIFIQHTYTQNRFLRLKYKTNIFRLEIDYFPEHLNLKWTSKRFNKCKGSSINIQFSILLKIYISYYTFIWYSLWTVRVPCDCLEGLGQIKINLKFRGQSRKFVWGLVKSKIIVTHFLCFES